MRIVFEPLERGRDHLVAADRVMHEALLTGRYALFPVAHVLIQNVLEFAAGKQPDEQALVLIECVNDFGDADPLENGIAGQGFRQCGWGGPKLYGQKNLLRIIECAVHNSSPRAAADACLCLDRPQASDCRAITANRRRRLPTPCPPSCRGTRRST